MHAYVSILVVLLTLSTRTMVFSQTTPAELPKEKQTTLGLYVTAKEAYEHWKATPEKLKILDVRTPDEFMHVGHASMAWNIPAFLQTYDWDSSKGHFKIKPNPDFMKHITETFKNNDTIYVMCRSGGRSAWAVNQLATAGFRNVYSITDGMEGDTVDDPLSVYMGQRVRNGWKNSGIPWTYQIDPSLMKLPRVQ